MNDNEAFEKFEAKRHEISVTGVQAALRCHSTLNTELVLAIKADAEVWQAALAHLREPQTAETCQQKPPHEVRYRKVDYDTDENLTIVYSCLMCQVKKQARDAALLEAAKAVCSRCEDGIELVKQSGEYSHVSWDDGDGGTLIEPYYQLCYAPKIHRLREEGRK